MTREQRLESRRLESRRVVESVVNQAGQALYDTYDDNERAVVQFGVQPYDKIVAAEEKLILELTENGETDIGGGYCIGDIGRLLSISVMDAANRGDKKMVC